MPRNPEHGQAQTASRGRADKTARPSAALQASKNCPTPELAAKMQPMTFAEGAHRGLNPFRRNGLAPRAKASGDWRHAAWPARCSCAAKRDSEGPWPLVLGHRQKTEASES